MKYCVLIIVIFLAVIAALFHLSGVVITAANSSSAQIKDVRIEYSRGVWEVGNLTENAVAEKRVGEIGEGSDFIVSWIAPNGEPITKSFSVYFFDNGLNTHINIDISGSQATLHYENSDVYIEPST